MNATGGALLHHAENAKLMITPAHIGFASAPFGGNSIWKQEVLLKGAEERAGFYGLRLRVSPGTGGRRRLSFADSRCAVTASLAAIMHMPHEDDAAAVPTSTLPKRAVRVLLADDHKILREGLASLLDGFDDISVVGEAEDGVQAVDLALQLKPDVVVMDITMPNLNGIEATRQIVDALPRTRVIGLSMHEEGDMAGALREAGATAYLTKGGPALALVEAIRSAGLHRPRA